MASNNLYSVEGVQAKLNQSLTCLDKELSQYKYANEIQTRTGVPKAYFALGAGGIVFIMLFFNLAGQLLTNTISWAYPAYASFKAIESINNTDDKQWLTYWSVIGFVQILECFSNTLLYWIPFYYLFKTLLVLWLALPQFRGAEVVYSRFLRPYLTQAQPGVDERVNQVRQKVSEASGVSKDD